MAPKKSPWLLTEGPLSFFLSLVAGFVDTAGFVALFGLFTAHITGNLVLIGDSLATEKWEGTLTRLIVLPIFVAAVMVTVWTARYLRARQKDPLGWLLAMEAAALGLFLIASVTAAPHLHSRAQQDLILLVGGTGVVAMGIHNSLMREAASHLLQTTVMTGNLTMFTTDLLVLLTASSQNAREVEEVAKARSRMSRTVPVLSGFLLGAGLGALGVRFAPGWCIAAPMLVMTMLAWAALRNG